MDDKDLEEKIEQALDESMENIEKSYEEAMDGIRTMVRAVYDGTADQQARDEYKEALEELMVAWVSLVTGIFQSINESPVSPAAIDFYTIMDTHRAMIDLDPRSPEIIDSLQEQGVLNKDDDDTH